MKKNAEIREYTRSFYQGNRLNFALALILIVLNTGGMLFFSWVLGEVTNIMAAGDLDRLWQTLGITVVALVLILTVELLMYYFKTKFVHKALRQYKDLAFSRLSVTSAPISTAVSPRVSITPGTPESSSFNSIRIPPSSMDWAFQKRP